VVSGLLKEGGSAAELAMAPFSGLEEEFFLLCWCQLQNFSMFEEILHAGDGVATHCFPQAEYSHQPRSSRISSELGRGVVPFLLLISVDSIVISRVLVHSLVVVNFHIAEGFFAFELGRRLYIIDEGRELVEHQLFFGCILLGSVEPVLVQEQELVDPIVVACCLPEDHLLHTGGFIVVGLGLDV
jgi:hypothetical protein